VASIFVLSAGSLSIGFLSDDYWLLASAKEQGVNFFGGWATHSSFYRPLVTVSFLLNLAVSNQPSIFHFFNILLHSINCLVLFFALRLYYGLFSHRSFSLTEATIFAFACVLLFAFHPANAHDVAWISGRTDLIAGLFSMLTIIFHLLLESNNRKMLWRIARGVFFLSAMASKEISLIVPLISFILTFQILVHRRHPGSLARRWREIIAKSFLNILDLIVLSLAYVAFRIFVAPYGQGQVDWSLLSFSEIVVFVVKCFYLYISPLDPLSSVYQYGKSPVLWILTAGVLASAIIYSITPAIQHGKKVFWIYSCVFMIGMLGAVSLNAYHGVISQRLMYVPLAATFLVAVPLVRLVMKSVSFSKARKGVVVGLYVIALISYVLMFHAKIQGWEKSSQFEKKLAMEIVAQSESPLKPIFILSYPYRFNQIVVMSTFPQLLYYYFYGQFGTLDNVKVGLQVIGTTFESVFAGATFSDVSNVHQRVLVETADPEQFLYVDLDEMKFLERFPILEVLALQKIRNTAVSVTVLSTNRFSRATKMEIEILDKPFYNEAQVFIFQQGKMVKIR